MAEQTKCKNCGAPIERTPKDYGKGYWRHVRDVHTGRLWCYPNVSAASQNFSIAAEPEGDTNASS